MERTGKITGKISANPNPVSLGQGCVVISWETNDPAGGEVRVLTSSGDEKLVSQGQSGQTEISWIVDSTVYDFRLYAVSQPDTPIDSVQVRRSNNDSSHALLRELATEVKRGTIDIMELSQFIATVMPRCLHSGKFHEIFLAWERLGFHVTPVHFYQPIPDTQSLPETLWNRASDLVGVNMNDSVQLDLLRNHFPKFRNEYEQFPTESTGNSARFHFNNGLFDGTDALVAYCTIRHFQPRVIIEVGSGFSSLLAALFIDSSHTVKIGGDVNYLFLEVLPRLKPGVIVHVHDILFPFDYRRDWVMDEFRFWAEQYLLQAFLSFNSEFEVLLSNSYLAYRYMEDLKATFPKSPWWGGGSFWMHRRSQH